VAAPEVTLARTYKALACQLALKIALTAKDFSAKFPATSVPRPFEASGRQVDGAVRSTVGCRLAVLARDERSQRTAGQARMAAGGARRRPTVA